LAEGRRACVRPYGRRPRRLSGSRSSNSSRKAVSAGPMCGWHGSAISALRILASNLSMSGCESPVCGGEPRPVGLWVSSGPASSEQTPDGEKAKPERSRDRERGTHGGEGRVGAEHLAQHARERPPIGRLARRLRHHHLRPPSCPARAPHPQHQRAHEWTSGGAGERASGRQRVHTRGCAGVGAERRAAAACAYAAACANSTVRKPAGGHEARTRVCVRTHPSASHLGCQVLWRAAERVRDGGRQSGPTHALARGEVLHTRRRNR
jgi:hypothetical protein